MCYPVMISDSVHVETCPHLLTGLTVDEHVEDFCCFCVSSLSEGSVKPLVTS